MGPNTLSTAVGIDRNYLCRKSIDEHSMNNCGHSLFSIPCPPTSLLCLSNRVPDISILHRASKCIGNAN